MLKKTNAVLVYCKIVYQMVNCLYCISRMKICIEFKLNLKSENVKWFFLANDRYSVGQSVLNFLKNNLR